jgi:RND superfamily putative drug exporter
MRSLARFVTGRRTKWVVVVAWLLLVAALSPLGGKLTDATDDRTESALPSNAQSKDVLEKLNADFPSGQTAEGLIVYDRPGGLTPRDRVKIRTDARRAQAELPLRGRPSLPFAPGKPLHSQVSESGRLAYTTLEVPNDDKKVADWGKDLRDITGDGAGGLKVYVTGDLGVQADFDEVFGTFDTKLLFATVVLVLVLLMVIYRSPLIAVIPLVVVGLAYQAATAFVYLLANSGATVTSTTTTILIVLMFGVGTDYCLLLVSRYREELRRTPDKHDAMARALKRAGPTILASGLTVAAAMLVLLVCETGSIRSLGPASAIGVTSVLLAGLTLLPALLTIAGRRGFWPRRETVAFDPELFVHEHAGIWRRVGDRVLQKPAAALAVTVAIFGFGALGLLDYKSNYSATETFTKTTESVDGFKALETVFPAGTLSPSDVIVENSNGPVSPQAVRTAQDRLRPAQGVADVSPPIERSSDGRAVRLQLVFADDPFTTQAFDRVPALRRSVADLGPNTTGLIGNGAAIQYDFNQAVVRDLKLIVPISFVVIGIILGVLLQAIVAPIVLIGSVVLSFFGTLGLSMLFFRHVAGQDGVDNSLPVFAFIFLVALGIDYTIFLMSRVREEARRHGTREGVLRALGATGPVITSAGIILAATFAVLMTFPVWIVFDIGFVVALGILLDTFIVRTIMVPAAVELIGDKIWWPSTAQCEHPGFVHEAPAEEEAEEEVAARGA